MQLGNSREQTITEILMDTQTEIKELIKYAIVNVHYMINFNERVLKIIDNNLKEIKDEDVVEIAKNTLLRFAQKEYQQMVLLLNLGQMPIILAFAEYNIRNSLNINEVQKQVNENINNQTRQSINRAYSQLGNSQAKVSDHQSLYGYAELNARFKEQQQMVAELRKKTNLVICDTHSDCSDRCFQWQGRIYSLDGTYGTTSDGRKYVPLEVATNAIFKGHRNGLLGYNCRHKLRPYHDGVKAVKVTKEEQQKQQRITTTQRALEREIRYSKDLALTFKGVDAEKYSYYKNKTSVLTGEYRKFCQDNNRVEYRSRLKI